ncbi:hypothetical protein [Streptomyces chromofuscus]|uniref:Secreted protein n=1 Tax=Streptomyces chromofuscus TaxID=42881 RepID=A0A7M2TCA8_STRCW|nr:hypothetical protein [Streptomyces chromofuscus]QOV46336.1 hypothetical protein IPT68_10730 [Streptomyces chromofuscus]GGS95312.1 hypothetical protein GCM10010254_14030 [Streptomyces chromofuscus]
MRIRSALAATVLAAALTATGAATAVAYDSHGQRAVSDEPIPCSPYEGSIDTVTADLEWAGALCHRGVFDY